jgi:hypothetical protein
MRKVAIIVLSPLKKPVCAGIMGDFNLRGVFPDAS